MDPLIDVPGIENTEASKDALENYGACPLLGELSKATGSSEGTILSEIEKRFGETWLKDYLGADGKLSPAELQRAVSDGKFPPKNLDAATGKELMDFIYAIDYNQRDWYQNAKGKKGEEGYGDALAGTARHAAWILNTMGYNGENGYPTVDYAGGNDSYTDDIRVIYADGSTDFFDIISGGFNTNFEQVG